MRRALAGLLAALLLLVSLIATSPGLHEAVHCEEDASQPHVCLLTLLRDGQFEPCTEVNPVPVAALQPMTSAMRCPPAPDFEPPAHRLPWALSPPVIQLSIPLPRRPAV
jgi:hypothetical protein